jgi:hypothetical protein
LPTWFALKTFSQSQAALSGSEEGTPANTSILHARITSRKPSQTDIQNSSDQDRRASEYLTQSEQRRQDAKKSLARFRRSVFLRDLAALR